MQDSIGKKIPACFSSSERPNHHHHHHHHHHRHHHLHMSVYRTKVADHCRLITITWCKSHGTLLHHGLSVSLQGPEGESQYNFKLELKPWQFWKKQGSKRLNFDGGKSVEILWDLKCAKFNGETEPSSEYYVAVVCDGEVALLLGDMKKDLYKRTGCRPSLIDPILVSKKEHIFGRSKFSTKAKFHEKGRFHEISIECKNSDDSSSGVHPEMEIRFDGSLVIHVKQLQWKFRGNENVNLNKMRVEVYWDVHDWLFTPGFKHALFIFKPVFLSPNHIHNHNHIHNVSISSSSGSSVEAFGGSSTSEFCLFIYAWKIE